MIMINDFLLIASNVAQTWKKEFYVCERTSLKTLWGVKDCYCATTLWPHSNGLLERCFVSTLVIISLTRDDTQLSAFCRDRLIVHVDVLRPKTCYLSLAIYVKEFACNWKIYFRLLKKITFVENSLLNIIKYVKQNIKCYKHNNRLSVAVHCWKQYFPVHFAEVKVL